MYEEAETAARLDSYMQDVGISKYRVITASVISNTVNRAQNLVVLNRGRRDGVAEEMALLASDGSMAGYVVDCTERYSVAMSVLNTSFRASGKLVGADYFGSIYWDGADPHTVVLDELSKYADPAARTGGRDHGLLAVFPRRRADRLGRKRRAERNPHGVQGARAAGGRNVAPDGCDSGREPRS